MLRRTVLTPMGLLALAAFSLLGAPRSANAALTLYLAEDGNAPVAVASAADFTDVSYSNTFGNFTVRLFGASSDNAASLSDLLSSTTSVKNNDVNTHTLHLWVSQDNYTLPAGTPLLVESGSSGTVNTGTVGLTGIFQAYASSTNDVSTITTGTLSSFDFTNGPQDATQTGSTFDTGSAFGLFNRSGSYALASVVNFTLSGGGQVNYSNHINVTATPEPANIVAIATGALPLLGFMLRRRRRRTA